MTQSKFIPIPEQNNDPALEEQRVALCEQIVKFAAQHEELRLTLKIGKHPHRMKPLFIFNLVSTNGTVDGPPPMKPEDLSKHANLQKGQPFPTILLQTGDSDLGVTIKYNNGKFELEEEDASKHDKISFIRQLQDNLNIITSIRKIESAITKARANIKELTDKKSVLGVFALKANF